MKKYSFQISVRFMLLLVLAVAIGLTSWFGFSHHLRVTHSFQNGKVDVIRRHAYWSPDSVLNNQHSGSLFEKAIRNGDVEMIKAILVAGPDLSDGKALEVALASKHPEVIPILLEAGAKPSFDGVCLASFVDVEIAEQFIEMGVSPFSEMDPLKLATTILKSADLMELSPATIEAQNALLKRHFRKQMGTVDSHGRTLLHHAAANGRTEIVGWLLSKGASTSHQDVDGATPLHLVCSNYLPNGEEPLIARALIEDGADVNAKRNDGATPLLLICSHIFTFSNDLDVIRALVQAGADVNVRKNNGETPLHMLCLRSDSLKIVDVLLNAGADINIKTNDGATPFELHLRNRNYNNISVAWCRLIPISRWPSPMIKGLIARGATKSEPIDVLVPRGPNEIEILAHVYPPNQKTKSEFTCLIYRTDFGEIVAVISAPLFPELDSFYEQQYLLQYDSTLGYDLKSVMSQQQLDDAKIQLDFETRTATFRVGDRIAQANIDTLQFSEPPSTESSDHEDQSNAKDTP